MGPRAATPEPVRREPGLVLREHPKSPAQRAAHAPDEEELWFAMARESLRVATKNEDTAQPKNKTRV